MPAGVDQAEVGVAKPFGQVFRGDQGIGHARSSTSWITSVRRERKPASH
jgi:hypothetical protein